MPQFYNVRRNGADSAYAIPGTIQTMTLQGRYVEVYLGDTTTFFPLAASDVQYPVANIIQDNLINREPEPEDAVLAESDLLNALLSRAMQSPASDDWEAEINGL